MTQYKGWTYEYYANAPITSKWQAARHGVSINAATEEMLRRMIDTRA